MIADHRAKPEGRIRATRELFDTRRPGAEFDSRPLLLPVDPHQVREAFQFTGRDPFNRRGERMASSRIGRHRDADHDIHEGLIPARFNVDRRGGILSEFRNG